MCSSGRFGVRWLAVTVTVCASVQYVTLFNEVSGANQDSLPWQLVHTLIGGL